MTTPRSPEGETTDIMHLDRDIEALRLGVGRTSDRGLALLLELRDSIDQRASTLLGEHHHEPETSWQPLAATTHVASAPRRRRNRHRHRFAVLPIAGAVVLASTGAAAAFSASPQAPLYPLHTLIFGSTSRSDAPVGDDLAQAQILLNRTAAEPYANRAAELAEVRRLLADAQRRLPETGSDRVRFAVQLAAERSQLAALEAPPTAVAPSNSPEPATPSNSPEPATPSEEAPATPSEGPTATQAPSEAETAGASNRLPGEAEATRQSPPRGDTPSGTAAERPDTGTSGAPD